MLSDLIRSVCKAVMKPPVILAGTLRFICKLWNPKRQVQFWFSQGPLWDIFSKQLFPCFCKPRGCFPILHKGVEPQFTGPSLNKDRLQLLQQSSNKDLYWLLFSPPVCTYMFTEFYYYFFLPLSTLQSFVCFSLTLLLRVANKVFCPGIEKAKECKWMKSTCGNNDHLTKRKRWIRVSQNGWA